MTQSVRKPRGNTPTFGHRAIVLSLIAVVFLGPSATVQPRASVLLSHEVLTIAQGQRRSAAQQAIEEGRKLRAEDTTDSLKAAIAKFEQALSLLEDGDDHRAKADLLINIGQIYLGLGEMRQALGYYNRALPLARAAGDRQLESDTLKGCGTVYRVFGENYKALDYYNQALALARAVNDQTREVWCLGSIGLMYYVLGDYQKSIDTYSHALLLAREKGYQGAEAGMLSSMGSVHNLMGDRQKALDTLNQALQLWRVRGDLLEQASALQSIGRVYHSIGDYKKAIDYLNQSLPLLTGANSRNSEARAHCNLGRAYLEMGEHQRALDHLNQALQIWRATGNQSNTAEATHWLARLERNRGNLSEALAQIDVALNIIEWMRAKAVTGELRSAYIGSVQTYYEFKIDVLTRLAKLDPSKDYTASAFQVSEMARARSLLETLIEAGADIRQDVSPGLIERERGIQQQLSAKAAEQMRLFSGAEPSKEQLAAVERQIEELSARYQEVQAEIRATSPRYAALTQPEPLSLAGIQQQLLDSQTVLLEYFLGAERSYLWLVAPDSIKGYELPKREEIEKSASRVYELLTARNRRVRFETVDEKRARIEKADAEYAEAAAALSRVVLGPVAPEIAGKRLLIVSDGALQYVPFAALPEPSVVVSDKSSGANARTTNNGPRTTDYGPPLAVEHEVVVLPSALTLAVLRREISGRKPAPRTIAVLADPVFDKDDERVKAALSLKKAGQPGKNIQARADSADVRSEIERSARESGWGEGELHIGRLPFTRKEAEVIADLVPASGRRQALDFEASRLVASSAELSQYRVVHFATHGFLNGMHPELSGLVLSLVNEQGREQDGFLRAHEIYNLKLPAELVVLSGCRTGLGKEIKGEGLVGLTRAFMYAGAARVLVSLWDINDKATAEFMTRFYRAMLGKEQMRPAAALRAAQASMWKERQWPSPYYWAAFVLQGEAR
jgi:CHAT domain-containing protein/Tfp pilus assembly protein PilF